MSTAIDGPQGIETILSTLSQPLPEAIIRQRVGWRDPSGQERMIDYIDWHTAADILDEVCPDWSHEVRDIAVIGDLVAVTAAITIKGVTRCGIGVDSALDERGIKGAEHDALKRAAVKFGLVPFSKLWLRHLFTLRFGVLARAQAHHDKLRETKPHIRVVDGHTHGHTSRRRLIEIVSPAEGGLDFQAIPGEIDEFRFFIGRSVAGHPESKCKAFVHRL